MPHQFKSLVPIGFEHLTHWTLTLIGWMCQRRIWGTFVIEWNKYDNVMVRWVSRVCCWRWFLPGIDCVIINYVGEGGDGEVDEAIIEWLFQLVLLTNISCQICVMFAPLPLVYFQCKFFFILCFFFFSLCFFFFSLSYSPCNCNPKTNIVIIIW